ncbi:pyridoxal 5'-phosphate synthase [Streptomyces melanogenes]|uniref:pyridoxal 5'-phosphate synthase n=1 Tax=Streptomyces melanogenes TaxID=67326 RepID=UPI0037AAD6AC
MGAAEGAGRPRDVRAWLRGLEVFAGPLAAFDPGAAPGDPVALFLDWLTEAVGAGLPDPHSMTVATVDEHGDPWARVLILKNVDADGWQFAAHADSPKGRQLAVRPSAALTFYWPALGRQVRVRGPVVREPAERGAADYLARSASARAEALVGRQSRHLDSAAERDRVIAEALARVEREPGLVAEAWNLYTVAPLTVEFWQADESRVHTRLRYERPAAGAAWERHLLWP